MSTSTSPRDTIYNLSLVNSRLQYLVKSESICKWLLELKVSHSYEARDALQDGRHARGLRRLIIRRRAMARAFPFSISIIGVAHSYALYNGKLLYILGNKLNRCLRILDLQNAINQEIVVYIPDLVTQVVPESKDCQKYQFKILYESAGITSCLYSWARPETQRWLIIFNAGENRVTYKVQLDSATRLFVRNNTDYLIYGTHSPSTDGIRRWVLRHYNLQTQTLSENEISLTNIVGYEIGSTVCFEIFDKYFYGCSIQSPGEQVEWTSYYCCSRFPLDKFNKDSIETMTKKQSFRRNHSEGPINDSWTFLALNQDEETGAVKIVESRREWPKGGGFMETRSYYTKEVTFPGQYLVVNEDLPDVITKRPPYEQHPGDLKSTMFARGATYLSLYLPSSQVFVDLVNDPPSDEPHLQRLRIRAGRKPRPANTTQHKGKHEGEHESDACLSNSEEIIEAAKQNIISFWPLDQACAETQYSTDMLEKLYQVMNPQRFRGHITAAGNERSIVYSTSSSSTQNTQVLVHVSFDPTVTLSGTIDAGAVVSGGEDIGAQCDTLVQNWEKYSAVVPQYAKNVLQPIAMPREEGVLWAKIEAAMHQNVGVKYGFNAELQKRVADDGNG